MGRLWWFAFVPLVGCGRLAFDAANDANDRDGAATAGDVAGALGFTDTFDRANQAGVGNGWVENTPGVFSITNGVVSRVVSGSDWTTNMVHRPASEDARDLEISLEFVVLDAVTPDWPQIFVRGRPASFDGYWMWIELGPTGSSTTIDVAVKQNDMSWWTALDQKTVPPAIVGERYRLRLRAVGAAPVVLDGWYERYDAPTWTTLLTLHATDGAPDALVGASTWGFGGNTGTAGGPYVYDNFVMTPL